MMDLKQLYAIENRWLDTLKEGIPNHLQPLFMVTSEEISALIDLSRKYLREKGMQRLAAISQEYGLYDL